MSLCHSSPVTKKISPRMFFLAVLCMCMSILQIILIFVTLYTSLRQCLFWLDNKAVGCGIREASLQPKWPQVNFLKHTNKICLTIKWKQFQMLYLLTSLTCFRYFHIKLLFFFFTLMATTKKNLITLTNITKRNK